MSVIVAEQDGPHILVCKGAVEEVFAVCNRVKQHGEVVMLEEGHYDELQNMIREFNEDGFRVIAVAYKELPPAQTTYWWSTMTAWCWPDVSRSSTLRRRARPRRSESSRTTALR